MILMNFFNNNKKKNRNDCLFIDDDDDDDDDEHTCFHIQTFFFQLIAFVFHTHTPEFWSLPLSIFHNRHNNDNWHTHTIIK